MGGAMYEAALELYLASVFYRVAGVYRRGSKPIIAVPRPESKNTGHEMGTSLDTKTDDERAYTSLTFFERRVLLS